MRAAWSADQAVTVREVRECLDYYHPVAYTTVMTVMEILHRKGLLLRVKDGRAWRYQPSESREAYDARLMAQVLLAGGDAATTMRRLLDRVDGDVREALRAAVLRSD
jgi:predicted transcriptional regulator